MKWVTGLLVILFIALQFRLWFGKHSVPDYLKMQQEVSAQRKQNDKLIQRNSLLKAEIDDLTVGLDAIEERARNELGLIKQGETFYRILPHQE